MKTRFILLAMSILLAGALAAGFAARAVVAPRAGEPVNAGVLNVPSVLGQTAEEVLFYPWSMYDAQTTLPLDSYPYGSATEERSIVAASASADPPFLQFLTPFQTLFDVSYDEGAIYDALELGQGQRLGHQLFLKDYAASLPEGETVLLSFATSLEAPLSISYLTRPAHPQQLTQEQQDQALAQVRSDLTALTELDPEPTGLTQILTDYLGSSQDLGLYDRPLTQLTQTIDVVYSVSACSEAGPLLINQTPLDGKLSAMEALSGYTVQLISTPQQIVLLFTGPDRSVVGVYYDIQLERYSGVGLSGG